MSLNDNTIIIVTNVTLDISGLLYTVK